MMTLIVRRHLAAALVLAGLIACSPTSRSEQASDSALADTLTAIIEGAYAFDRPGALERMSALYAESDRVVSASGGVITLSADSVRAGIANFWELAGQNMRDATWTWGEVHVDRLSADAAVLTATWSIPHIAPAGQPHVIEGAWTAVFRRLEGEWKIIHEHLSTPPA